MFRSIKNLNVSRNKFKDCHFCLLHAVNIYFQLLIIPKNFISLNFLLSNFIICRSIISQILLAMIIKLFQVIKCQQLEASNLNFFFFTFSECKTLINLSCSKSRDSANYLKKAFSTTAQLYRRLHPNAKCKHKKPVHENFITS